MSRPRNPPRRIPRARGPGSQSAGQSGGPSGAGAQASSSGTLELTTENFAAQVEELSSLGKAHEGQRVELTGFVMSEASARGQASIPRLTSEESFAVARMAIWCCAADAYAVGFVVRWDGAVPAADSWVHVAGTLRLRGNKALVIEADSVEATSAPDPEFGRSAALNTITMSVPITHHAYARSLGRKMSVSCADQCIIAS